MAKSIAALLIGVKVRTTKPINWHELRIPKGTLGTVQSIEGRGAALVRFDNGSKYGSFTCWAKELKIAK